MTNRLSETEIRAITSLLLNNQPILPYYRHILLPHEREGGQPDLSEWQRIQETRLLKRVLLVENDPVLRQKIRHQLSLNDFVVIDVPSGDEIFDLLTRLEFDAVLGSLSEMGLDTAQMILQMHEFIRDTGTPVVLMVEEKEMAAGLTCIQCGAYDLVLKPVIPGLMSSVLESALTEVSIYGLNRSWKEGFGADLVRRLTDPLYEPIDRGSVLITQMPDAFLLSFLLLNITDLFASMPLDDWLDFIRKIIGEVASVATAHEVKLIRNSGFSFLATSSYDHLNPATICAIAEMALELRSLMPAFLPDRTFRMGISAGPVITGEEMNYTKIWGEAVEKTLILNLEGINGEIQVDERAHERLKDQYRFEARLTVNPADYSEMRAYLLAQKKTVGSGAGY